MTPVKTDVSKDEIEDVIKRKGKIVVEVVTDKKEGIKRTYEAPAKVKQAIRAFLRVCNAKSVPVSNHLREQLEILNDFLGEAVLLLASSPNPIQGRLQVIWDDYLKHLTPEHMPVEDLKAQIEGLLREMQEREPQDMTDEEASDFAFRVVMLHSAVVTHISEAWESVRVSDGLQ